MIRGDFRWLDYRRRLLPTLYRLSMKTTFLAFCFWRFAFYRLRRHRNEFSRLRKSKPGSDSRLGVTARYLLFEGSERYYVLLAEKVGLAHFFFWDNDRV
jgi:hypothetical protein